MKILLIGEFSGVHNNLKKGLTSLGHEVKIAAEGDGYKKFDYDYRITPFKVKIIGKYLNILYFLLNIGKFTGFDVVQFISPFALPYYYKFFGLTNIIFKFNKKKIYYACGTDPAFLESKKIFDYFPFDDPKSKEYPSYNWWALLYYYWFLKKVDRIIPSMYSYAAGYFTNPKLTKVIPLPGSGNCIKEINNVGEKIKILFGITRREFKGAKYIEEALNRIKIKYPNLVLVDVVEKIPFNDYKLLLQNTDIVIDQCKSYDYGMNAVEAMESGAVVLSGFEPEAMRYLGVDKSPVFNIPPDSDYIVKLLDGIINNKNIIDSLKIETIQYVRNIHDLQNCSYNFISLYL